MSFFFLADLRYWIIRLDHSTVGLPVKTLTRGFPPAGVAWRTGGVDLGQVLANRHRRGLGRFKEANEIRDGHRRHGCLLHPERGWRPGEVLQHFRGRLISTMGVLELLGHSGLRPPGIAYLDSGVDVLVLVDGF